ncbi:hypothetical protein [Salipiger sp.]|uniref:hypothetical protein n=1 Tax=Salipiger sp. TaxID=2078585 RepID=UPI003A96E596
MGFRTKAGGIGKLVVVKHDADHVRREMARFTRREGAPFELFSGASKRSGEVKIYI